jgi:hypothetical protein
MPNFIDEEIGGCLELASTIADQVAQANDTARRDTGRDFSALQFFSIGEVATTHILAYFLCDTADHGQGRLFQDLFFRRLRPSAFGARLPQTTWRVDAETRYTGVGQLDLLLTSADRNFGILSKTSHATKPSTKTINYSITSAF